MGITYCAPWSKIKEIRETSHRDVIHGNQSQVCMSSHPHRCVCNPTSTAVKVKTTQPHQYAVTQRNTTTVTIGSNKPANTYTMPQPIYSHCKSRYDVIRINVTSLYYLYNYFHTTQSQAHSTFYKTHQLYNSINISLMFIEANICNVHLYFLSVMCIFIMRKEKTNRQQIAATSQILSCTIYLINKLTKKCLNFNNLEQNSTGEHILSDLLIAGRIELHTMTSCSCLRPQASDPRTSSKLNLPPPNLPPQQSQK